MNAILFIIYLLLFCWLITRITFFRRSGLRNIELVALFLAKVAAGVAYGKFYQLPKYYAGSDTWRFYRLSIKERNWLVHDPIGFVKDLFVHKYSAAGSLFAGENSYWNDLKSNVVIKLLAVTNALTFNNYYADLVIFNFLFLVGLVALFKVFTAHFGNHKYLIVTGIFLLPSTLFWCSGIHKDGLILSALGLLIYMFERCLSHKISVARVLVITFCAVILFSLRNYVLLLILPALFCRIIGTKFPQRRAVIYTGVYALIVFLFFALPFVNSTINPPQVMAEKQHEFLRLGGTSTVIKDPLQPSFRGYVAYLPKAIDIGFLRPHPNELVNKAFLPAIAELFMLYLLVGYCLIRCRKSLHQISPLLYLICFGISVLIVCGYTVTITGAIVRYRSLVLPFIITPFLCLLPMRIVGMPVR